MDAYTGKTIQMPIMTNGRDAKYFQKNVGSYL